MGVVVSLDGDKRKPSLNTLTEIVGDDLGAVNRLILHKMESPVALIPQLAGHIIAAGGKRLRPLCVALAARVGRKPRALR